ncbi:PLP-dependent aminotransferase family protein [Bacillus sp. 1P10SD]|uniref:MocR-like pyridoxine biosynthesis transcription factor PdxR n=1 Tax=Bacillus sp. 1P10SD TaxID=3132265 RepID=UPI0039A40B72
MLPHVQFDFKNKNIPQYERLYKYYQQEITSGNLVENSRLPSIRELADFLGLSTTPVEMAYQQLVAEGYIKSKPKSGYYVEKIQETFQIQADLINSRALSSSDQFSEFDFHMSKNDFTQFPFKEWKLAYHYSLDSLHLNTLFYGDRQGEVGLREQIARYVRKIRGVRCSANQIIIGAEQQNLISLLSYILKQKFLQLAVEDPGYPLAPETFRLNGFSVTPIPLDEDGISIQDLYSSGAKIVCVTPSHQFPIGITMSLDRRMELLKWSTDVNGYIIEDDYDGEFRYYGNPVPSLQGMERRNNVIYLGSFSQVLAPAIGVSYMILPEQLLPDYHEIKNYLLNEQGSSKLHQHALEYFMKQGYLEKHIRKMRNIYRKKHDCLLTQLHKEFGSAITINGKDAGFHMYVRVQSTKSETEMLKIAREAGINIASASYTWNRKSDYPGKEFIIGFAGIEKRKIIEGIKLLADLWIME